MTSFEILPGSRARQVGTILILSALAAALAGCKHDNGGAQVAGWALVDPSQRHPIIVSRQPETLTLHTARGSTGLNPQQRAELLDFTARSRAADAGNSRLIIQAPSGSANEVAAMHAVQEIRELLSDNGFAESAIAVEAYSDGGHTAPPVRVSFMRYVAEGPDCDAGANLARSPQNLPSPNLGCSNQRNFAAMVANPGDLLGPRTESDRASERRDTTWGKYKRGEPTGADRSAEEKLRDLAGN